MTNRVVTIDYGGDKYKVDVPEDVPAGKLDLWKDLWVLEKEYESLPKSIETSCGRVLSIPSRGFDLAVQNMEIPEEEKKDLFDLRKKKSTLMQKIMNHRLRVFGRAKSEKRNKTLEECGSQIIELAGREYTSAEIHRQILKEGREGLEYSDVLTFIKRNEDKIREVRNKFRENYTDLSLTVKRSRLEKLNLILNHLLNDFDNSKNFSSRVVISKEVRGILEQARKEVEGDEIKLTVSGRIDIEATINNHISESKLLQGLTLQQIVISRVATRIGISSQFLLDKLAKGWYSKFNGFRKNADITTKPIYPTEIKYDILDLEDKNKRLSKQNEKLVEEVEYCEVRKDINKNLLKDLLLKEKEKVKKIKKSL